jgi:hypothetical protein
MDQKFPSIFVSVYDSGDEYENRLHHWLRLGYWSLQEAAALISDIEPDSIEFSNDRKTFSNALTLREIDFSEQDDDDDEDGVPVDENGQPLQGKIDARKALLRSYCQKVRDAERILSRISPKRENASPEEWIKAALEQGLDVPWLRWAERTQLARAAGELASADDKPVSEKERTSMLKVIAALCAMENLDKNRATKSAAVIRNKCAELGFSISENTIVKYLKAAAALNPDD